jgi:hypothetical protein
MNIMGSGPIGPGAANYQSEQMVDRCNRTWESAVAIRTGLGVVPNLPDNSSRRGGLDKDNEVLPRVTSWSPGRA